eukprot:1120952-Prymnesium_polylepis.1
MRGAPKKRRNRERQTARCSVGWRRSLHLQANEGARGSLLGPRSFDLYMIASSRSAVKGSR